MRVVGFSPTTRHETHAGALREGRWTPLPRRALCVFELDGQLIRRIIDYGR